MQEILTRKLLKYITDNHPDLLVRLEEDDELKKYLSEKTRSAIALMKHLENEPPYIIEEACMELFAQELGPSKFNYILNILEDEFPGKYEELTKNGTLKYEVINIIIQCQDLFEDFHFSPDSEDDNALESAIVGSIQDYIESKR